MDVSSSALEGAFSTMAAAAHFRLRRHKQEARRARANLNLLLAASAGSVRYRGADPVVSSLAATCRFAPHDLIIARVTVRQQVLTLMIAPRRVWHSPERRQRLVVLKTNAARVGRRIILVPEPQLRKQPRLSTAKQILSAGSATISTSERVLLENYVETHGRQALEKCSGMLASNTDPFGAVLLLVGAGRLCIDLNRRITPASPIWSPER